MLGYPAALRYLKAELESDRAMIYAIAIGAREVQRQHDLERAQQIAERVLGGINFK